MSFISDKVSEYESKQITYTIRDLEQIVADCILDSAKSHIKWAIERGEHHISMAYTYDEGVTISRKMDETVEEYLKSWYASVIHLSDLVFPKDLSRLVYENEERLNLSNIEYMIREGIINLGAKQVTVYVRFCDYAYVTVQKSGFFRSYNVEEERVLQKYKVCYTVSW